MIGVNLCHAGINKILLPFFTLTRRRCGGGDLLGTLTQHQYLTEYEVCHYVRQILSALEYMHDRCIAHLGLNVSTDQGF